MAEVIQNGLLRATIDIDSYEAPGTTATSVGVAKAASKLNVTGDVVPAHPGGKVAVLLQKKTATGFTKVSSTRLRR